MSPSRRNAGWLAASSGVAALAFAALTVAVARGRLTQWDRRTKRRIQSSMADTEATRDAALATAPLGKWWSQVGASLTGAARLLFTGRRAAAGTIVGASVGAALLTPLLERVVPVRRPPPEHPEHADPSKQSYPSGHALRTSATAVATSYVLWREGSAPWAGGPLAVISFATTSSKLLLSRHWTTDVIGGYLAGIAWAGACASVYELARD
jgi:membrane-associated phospholipid phosphatase